MKTQMIGLNYGLLGSDLVQYLITCSWNVIQAQVIILRCHFAKLMKFFSRLTNRFQVWRGQSVAHQ
ncbi:hypothetical protein P353_22560 [Comamonas testosteroni]|uniref:Uncharacterized protein n=1 Tax=Comamonas testosteroni TaxID=285 RepID=A0A096GM26_COMTE|nr:hypothetical protein P353_22560 [Comamonas testosteroni]